MNISVAARKPQRSRTPGRHRRAIRCAWSLTGPAGLRARRLWIASVCSWVLPLSSLFSVSLYHPWAPFSPFLSTSFDRLRFTSLLPSMAGAKSLGSTTHHDRLVLWNKAASLVQGQEPVEWGLWTCPSSHTLELALFGVAVVYLLSPKGYEKSLAYM